MITKKAFNVLVLGGYGNAGQCITHYLLTEFPSAKVIIAGRNLSKGRETAQRLNDEYSATEIPRVEALRLDAARPEQLIQAFSRANLVINAASTIPWTRNLLEAAIKTRTDYLDTHLSSPEKWKILRSHRERLKTANVCYVTDGGFHPGIPATLVRYAAEQMDEMVSARVFGGMRIDWGKLKFSPSTVSELVEEFRYFKPLIYEEGQWKKQSFRHLSAFDFGPPLGPLVCTPMDMEEMHHLPQIIPSLREIGFYISGFNSITDNWIMPIVYLGIRIFPRSWSMPFARIFHWSLKFSRPPFGLKLTAICKGLTNDQDAELRISLSHEDGYVLTAVPVIAFVHQWLQGQIRRPGLWMQAHIVEPAQFLEDLARMGITVEKSEQGESEVRES